jgi:LysR family nitrogen assimilation transcriptional regulator
VDIKQMRQFLAVVRTGSLSRAAVVLGVAQPFLTKQMQTLEEHLGEALLYRNGRGVVPTEAGRLLEQYAETIVSATTEAESAIRALSAAPTGEVVIGIPPMIGATLTVPVVEAFRAEYPSISLRVVEAYSGYILEWLTSGRLDVGIIYNIARTTFQTAEPLVEEGLYLVAAPGVPIEPAGDEVGPADLASVPLVIPNRPNGLRTLVDSYLTKHGKKATIAVEVDGLSALIRLVEHGIGATVMSSGLALRYRAEGRLRAWKIGAPPLTGEIYLATSTQRPSTAVTRKLVKIVQGKVKLLSEANGWRQIR